MRTLVLRDTYHSLELYCLEELELAGSLALFPTTASLLDVGLTGGVHHTQG